MKESLFVLTIIATTLTARSQSINYKAFKVDVSFGYAIPSGGNGIKGGATFTVEPHYRIKDNIALGLRLEGAALGYEIKLPGGSSDPQISLLNSYCATGEYYFKGTGLRPFAGAGLGAFVQSSVDVSSSSGSSAVLVPGSTRFGFFPTLGFEAGHFRLAGCYNIIGNSNNYAAFKIGFFLGGGKKAPVNDQEK